MGELIVRDSLTSHPFHMRLLLLLLLYPVIVTPKCAPGDINGSCARIKANQYQIRGVPIKPYWTHVIYGGRDIRRHQRSTGIQAFEKPAMEFNLRPAPTYAAQRLALPVQVQPSFQVSGAVRHQPRLHMRTQGVKSLALNKDPIDSFERAVGGDEFDNRDPVEPIRLIKIESTEMIEPALPARKIGSNPVRTKKIIESLTRHLNEIRSPKVIPFSNRDEIVNGQIISQPDVKITTMEAKQGSKKATNVGISSSEIANGILENILKENLFAKNASELLRVLTRTEETTSDRKEVRIARNGTKASDSDIEVSSALSSSADNVTDSSFLNLDNINEKLDLGAEMDDYSDDDEWEAFSDTGGSSAVSGKPHPPRRQSTRREVPHSGAVTASPSNSSTATPSSGADSISATISTRKSEKVVSELEALNDNEENREAEEENDPTTATTGTSNSASPSARPTAEKKGKSEESSEESSEEEESTTNTPEKAAKTTTSIREGFRAAIKKHQEEVVRMKMERNKDDGDVANQKSSGSESITELNSGSIKSTEKEEKPKKRLRKIGREGEEDNEEDIKEKPDLPVGGEEATQQNLAGVQGENDLKKNKIRIEKVTKTEVTSEGFSKEIGEAITKNLQEQVDPISKENKGKDEEDSTKKDDDKEDGKTTKKKETKGGVEELIGAGAQSEFNDEDGALQTEIKNSEQITVTIEKPQKGKDKQVGSERSEGTQDEENDGEEKNEEESIDDKKANEEIEEEEEKPEDVLDATTAKSKNDGEDKRDRKNEKKGKEKKTGKKVGEEEEQSDDIEKGDEKEEEATPKIGSDNSNIRTGNVTASLKDAPNAKYYYPPKVMVPLPTCFYNPSGYVCCNLQLNNLIEDTFEEIKNTLGYSACNIAKVANIMQQKSEEMFEHPFESIVALSDFAQNVHFAGDLVCKVEIDGKYMLTYATPYDADNAIAAVGVPEASLPRVGEKTGKEGKKKTKKPNKVKKKSLPIHNFRM